MTTRDEGLCDSPGRRPGPQGYCHEVGYNDDFVRTAACTTARLDEICIQRCEMDLGLFGTASKSCLDTYRLRGWLE